MTELHLDLEKKSDLIILRQLTQLSIQLLMRPPPQVFTRINIPTLDRLPFGVSLGTVVLVLPAALPSFGLPLLFLCVILLHCPYTNS